MGRSMGKQEKMGQFLGNLWWILWLMVDISASRDRGFFSGNIHGNSGRKLWHVYSFLMDCYEHTNMVYNIDTEWCVYIIIYI
jgi:hypothetical protein